MPPFAMGWQSRSHSVSRTALEALPSNQRLQRPGGPGTDASLTAGV
jgi:hypothetical protein